MKRILSLLLALVIAISAAVPAYATGDGNFDGGGGSMGDGTKTNYWNPGMDGVRVSIVDAGSHSVVRTPIDLTNKVPVANVAHFGKVSKLSYNAGRGLSVSVSGYSYRNPSQSLPKIISTGSSKASIAAIRSYFTDEQVIRSIAGYVEMDFDTLIGGDYKLVVEPLAYLCYNGQQFAMTATEAALYDQVVNGDLRKKLGTLTHKNLPLAIFLEEADLGYAAWSGSRTDKASNGDIISSLGRVAYRCHAGADPRHMDDQHRQRLYVRSGRLQDVLHQGQQASSGHHDMRRTGRHYGDCRSGGFPEHLYQHSGRGGASHHGRRYLRLLGHLQGQDGELVSRARHQLDRHHRVGHRRRLRAAGDAGRGDSVLLRTGRRDHRLCSLLDPLFPAEEYQAGRLRRYDYRRSLLRRTVRSVCYE